MTANVARMPEDPAWGAALLEAARASAVTLHGTSLAPAQVSSLGRGLHVLTAGHVKLVRFSAEGRALILELLGAGDLFGDVDVVEDEDVAPTYVEALTPARFETLEGRELELVLRPRSSLSLAVARRMGERRRRIERRLEAHIFQNVPTRLAHQLLELAARYGEPDPRGTRIAIRLSQQDLGSLIGASRESVSLTLNQFRTLGGVTSTRRQLVVRPRKLAEMAREGGLG